MPEKPTHSVTDTEVAIAGGGLVGMALALSLAQQGITSVLLEAQVALSQGDQVADFDDRTLVINPASQQFWQSMGIWPAVEAHCTAIDQVHVSNQGQFGVVQFNKDELAVDQLGHVMPAKTLAVILLQQVQKHPLIKLMQPARLLAFEQHEQHTKLEIDYQQSQQTVQAQLMVGADGVRSAIRSKLQLNTTIKSYQNTAIICSLRTNQEHHNRAFERLTQAGPMAMLPYADRFGFVWSMQTAQAEAMMNVDDREFMTMAQQQFGHRAGEFIKIGRRSSYPLYQIKVPKQYAPRVLLMGNAAHAVSPVSAQGLNLAVRGIDRLSKILAVQHKQGHDLGSEEVLDAYQQASLNDQNRTLGYTDDLMTWFKIDEPMVNLGRSMSLVAINASIPLKKWLFRTAGGLRS